MVPVGETVPNILHDSEKLLKENGSVH